MEVVTLANGPARSRRDVGAAVAGTVSSSLPVFLTGALAVQIRSSLGFGTTAFGLAVALYYLAAGTSSIPLGHLSEALGGARAMRLAAAGAAVVLAGLAAAARSFASLAGLLLVAGVASAAMQPAANLFLSNRIPPERQGLSFGIKQAAVPLATFLAGLAVPAMALTVGWRWAFATGAAWAAGTAALLPGPAGAARQGARRRPAAPAAALARGPLIVLAVGFGIGIAVASALTAFLVSSAVAGGMSRGQAGLLVAFGGLAAVAARVVVGYLADRRPDRDGRAHLGLIAGMLAVGAAGYGGLALAAVDRRPLVYVLAAAVVFPVGWGWNGLFNFAVVRMSPGRAGRATGLTQAGGRLGGMVGPFSFGLLAGHVSYSAAWVASGGALLAAAGTVLAARRMLSRAGLEEAAAPAPAGPASG